MSIKIGGTGVPLSDTKRAIMKTQLPSAPLATFTPHDGALEVVEVFDIDGNSRRMCELGICTGKIVSIIRQGDPAILCIGESRFALSAELLSRVYVRPAKHD